MRLRAVLLGVFAVALFGPLPASCNPRQGWGPSFEQATKADDSWPKCITDYMQQRMAYCPAARSARPGPPCQAVVRPLWPARNVESNQAGPPSFLGRSRSLDQAERLFSQAHKTKRYSLAQRAFERIVKTTNAATQPVWAIACYRLAQLRRLASDSEQALLDYARLWLTLQLQPAAAAEASWLQRQALREFADTYGQLDKAPAVFAIVEQSAADPARRSDVRRFVELLSQELVAAGRHRRAIDLSQELIYHDVPQACLYRAREVESALALGDDDAVLRALNEQLAAYVAPTTSAAVRERCGYWAARQLLEVAGRWTSQAVGGGNAAKKLDRRRGYSMGHSASELYRAVLAGFHQDDLRRLGICTDLTDAAYTRAELLSALGAWDVCGAAYDWAIAAYPSGERLPRAAHNAMICRQNALLQMRASLAAMPTEQRIAVNLKYTESWRKLLRAYHRVMCVGGGRDQEEDGLDTVGLARGQTFYEGGALWEAAIVFRNVAQQAKRAVRGAQAAQRYAEIMEDLAQDDVCRRELTLDLEQLQAVYCVGRPASTEACEAMSTIVDRVGFNARPQL